MPPHPGSRDESGAVLILALVFLVAVSLIVIALLNWVGTSLSATTTFANERSLEYAATSSVNLAIQNTRYTFASQLTNASPPQACWYDSSGHPQQPQTFNGQSVDVWCSMVWRFDQATTRTITFSACPSTVSNVACAATPLLQAVIIFDDYPMGVGVPASNPVYCTGYCGQSMTQVSWQWRPTVPSVSSILPTTATVNGTNAASGNPQTITISGNGLVNGSSVNLVQETGLSPGTGLLPQTPSVPSVVISIPSSQVTWGGCSGSNNTNCTLSFTAPAVTSGADYFVTVTTPGGTSAYVRTQGSVNLDDLQYSAVVPVVTGISGTAESNGVPGGSMTGGSTITINGSGFYSAPNFAAQVWFWPSGGGSKFPATNVSISTIGTMTATTPAVSAPGNYYVQVVTLGGSSTNTSDIFNYGVQVPIIISMSPTSGKAGDHFTINGANFLAGSTVVFCLDIISFPFACQSPGSASATVTSQSSMTVTVPSGLFSGVQYFPVITLPPPYDNNSSQPYNEPADIFTAS